MGNVIRFDAFICYCSFSIFFSLINLENNQNSIHRHKHSSQFSIERAYVPVNRNKITCQIAILLKYTTEKLQTRTLCKYANCMIYRTIKDTVTTVIIILVLLDLDNFIYSICFLRSAII